MAQVRVATISYINSIPFVYGIKHTAKELCADICLHTPSGCVSSFLNKKCDIAIVPVAALQGISDAQIISNYCISATNDVRTVVLMSDTPIEDITTIYLDEDSRTSAQLLRILAREYWHISPTWGSLSAQPIPEGNIPRGTAYMLIGDKVFQYENRYKYNYDLAHAWFDMTSLPFVFAVWIARQDVDPEIIKEFNSSLEYGLNHLEESIIENVRDIPYQVIKDYLTNNIEYILTEDKRRAIELFISKSQAAEPSSQK